MKILHPFLLAGMLLTGGLMLTPNTASAQTVEQLDEIIALVEEDIILRSELDIAVDGVVQRIRADRRQPAASEPD